MDVKSHKTEEQNDVSESSSHPNRNLHCPPRPYGESFTSSYKLIRLSFIGHGSFRCRRLRLPGGGQLRPRRLRLQNPRKSIIPT